MSRVQKRPHNKSGLRIVAFRDTSTLGSAENRCFRVQQEITVLADSFTEMMFRLRKGDQDAAAQIFNRFTRRLVGLARVHLDSRVRQKVDPEDVLQSVYKSFFLRYAQGEVALGGWDGLWGMLALITARKCGRCVRRFHAARRDVDAEIAESGSADDSSEIEAFSDEPSPAEAIMLSEVVEQLLCELGQRDGEILTLGSRVFPPPRSVPN